ncbi:MAG TPA: glycosyltransferase family 4 protein [Sphingobium sp.]|nr:glycosyltransferase family 4 protein [Sphingobium sp.]
MSKRAGKTDRTGPFRVLHLRANFERDSREAPIVRLMNHWGQRISHDLLLGDPFANSARRALDPGLAVRFLREPVLQGRPTSGKLLALGRLMQNYDLVLSFGWGAINGIMAHRLLRRVEHLPPLIHHAQGIDVHARGSGNSTRNLYRRIALAGIHALVVPSNRLAHVAQQEWHIKAERVHQIPNGIDVAAYAAPSPRSGTPGLAAQDGRLIVGTAAGAGSEPAVGRLMRAIAPLRDRLRLAVMAEGADRESILAEAAAQGLDDVLMPPVTPLPQDYLGLIDIFAFSPDSGPFPVSLVEAMAAGRPIVAPDFGDVSAMVAPANRRFVARPDDAAGLRAALEALAVDPDLRAHLGEANRKRARQCFDEAVMVRLYAGLYGAAMGDPLALI